MISNDRPSSEKWWSRDVSSYVDDICAALGVLSLVLAMASILGIKTSPTLAWIVLGLAVIGALGTVIRLRKRTGSLARAVLGTIIGILIGALFFHPHVPH